MLVKSQIREAGRATKKPLWHMLEDSDGSRCFSLSSIHCFIWLETCIMMLMLYIQQNTALARRLSLTNRTSMLESQAANAESPNAKPAYRRSRSYMDERDASRTSTSSSLHPQQTPRRRSQSSIRSNPLRSPNVSPQISPGKQQRQVIRRSFSSEKYNVHASPLAYERGHPLAPIPGSPYATDASPPGSPSSKRSASRASHHSNREKEKEREKPSSSAASPPKDQIRRKSTSREDEPARSRSIKSVRSNINTEFTPYRPPQPQSLTAALEKIANTSSPESTQEKDKQSDAEGGKRFAGKNDDRPPRFSSSLGRVSGQAYARPRVSIDPTSVNAKLSGSATVPNSPMRDTNKENKTHVSSKVQLSPPSRRSIDPNGHHSTSVSGKLSDGRLLGRDISAPVFDAEATMKMSPVKMRNTGKPILLPHASEQNTRRPSMSELKQDGLAHTDPGMYFPKRRTSTLNTG